MSIRLVSAIIRGVNPCLEKWHVHYILFKLDHVSSIPLFKFYALFEEEGVHVYCFAYVGSSVRIRYGRYVHQVLSDQ